MPPPGLPARREVEGEASPSPEPLGGVRGAGAPPGNKKRYVFLITSKFPARKAPIRTLAIDGPFQFLASQVVHFGANLSPAILVSFCSDDKSGLSFSLLEIGWGAGSVRRRICSANLNFAPT